MTIEEAEVFFKYFNGNGYHMCHDETGLYNEFLSLNLSEEILNKWRDEKIQSLYNELWLDKENVCWKIYQIFEMISYPRINIKQKIETLLTEVKKCVELDNFSRIIIIEDFAGRTKSQETGICYFICKYTELNKEMNEIVTDLIDSITTEDSDLQKRLDKAIINYKKAYKKFSKRIGFQYKE